MEQSLEHSETESTPSSALLGASASSLSTSQVHEDWHSDPRHYEDNGRYHPSAGVTYRVDVFLPAVRSSELGYDVLPSTGFQDDVWSCLIVLLTFCFFASMTLIIGFYGSANLEMGPNCSRLFRANPFFVQSIKVREIDDSITTGSMLYGFYKPPPLDIEVTWTETHNVSVAQDIHKEWIYFLNRGSKINISYSVQSSSSSPLSLVIAQGKESLVGWIEDPSYPNTTLSWNNVHGSGEIQQEILVSSDYYIAVGNLNFEEVQIQLNFSIWSIQYNTSKAHYKCLISRRVCAVQLFLLRKNVAILTTPNPKQNTDWRLKLSFGPRWITYIIGSGLMTVILLICFKFCYALPPGRGDDGGGGMDPGRERGRVVKEDDISSWGSSFDSAPNLDDDLEEQLLTAAARANEGETSGDNPHGICIICFDAPRDCFFLPCGHCAACFSCGTRVTEERGSCPICRRAMKKVRRIFTV